MAYPTRTANDKLNMRTADVEVSVDSGSTWDQVDSYMVSIVPDTAELAITSFRTLDATIENEEDDALDSESITISMVATDAVDGLYDVLYAASRSTTKTVDLRWSQGSATTGDRLFTTVGGKVVSCPALGFDSTTAGFVIVQAKVVCDSITKGTAA